MKNNYTKINYVAIFIGSDFLNNLYAVSINILAYSDFTFLLVWASVLLSIYNSFNKNLIYKVLNLIFLSVSVITMWIYSSEFLFIFVAYIVAFVGAVMMLFLSVVLMLPTSVVSATRIRNALPPVFVLNRHLVSLDYSFYFWYLRVLTVLLLLMVGIRYLACKYPEFNTRLWVKLRWVRGLFFSLPRRLFVFIKMFFSLFKFDFGKLRNGKWPIVRQGDVWKDPQSLVGYFELWKYIVIRGGMITIMSYEYLYRKDRKGQKKLADDLFRATMILAREFHKKTGFRWYCYTWLDLFNWSIRKVVLLQNLFAITSMLITNAKILQADPTDEVAKTEVRKYELRLRLYEKSHMFWYMLFSEILNLFTKVNGFFPHAPWVFWGEFFGGSVFAFYLLLLVIPKKMAPEVVTTGPGTAGVAAENPAASENLTIIKKILFEDNPEYLYISVVGLLVALVGCVVIAHRRSKK